MVQKFAFRLFTFFILFIFGLIILGSVLMWLGVPIVLVNLIFLILSSLFLFVPQAIVVDEVSIRYSMLESLEFIRKNRGIFALILVLGSVLLAVILLLEYLLDVLTIGVYIGRLVCFLIVAFFLIPFFEALKTYVYMMKFEMLKGPERMKHVKY